MIQGSYRCESLHPGNASEAHPGLYIWGCTLEIFRICLAALAVDRSIMVYSPITNYNSPITNYNHNRYGLFPYNMLSSDFGFQNLQVFKKPNRSHRDPDKGPLSDFTGISLSAVCAPFKALSKLWKSLNSSTLPSFGGKKSFGWAVPSGELTK